MTDRNVQAAKRHNTKHTQRPSTAAHAFSGRWCGRVFPINALACRLVLSGVHATDTVGVEGVMFGAASFYVRVLTPFAHLAEGAFHTGTHCLSTSCCTILCTFCMCCIISRIHTTCCTSYVLYAACTVRVVSLGGREGWAWAVLRVQQYPVARPGSHPNGSHTKISGGTLHQTSCSPSRRRPSRGLSQRWYSIITHLAHRSVYKDQEKWTR